MVPKTQRFDALLCKIFLPFRITLNPLGQTMLKPVQFHSDLCIGTIEIQNVISHRILAAKLETRKTPPTQRPPKLLFFVGLVTTKFTGDLF